MYLPECSNLFVDSGTYQGLISLFRILMADLGITGKRVRKKPKYLRDEEEDEPEPAAAKSRKTKSKRKAKKESKKGKTAERQKPGIKLKIKFGSKASSSQSADVDVSPQEDLTYEGSDELDIENEDGLSQNTLVTSNPSHVYEESEVDDYEDYEMEMSQLGDSEIPPSVSGEKEDTSDEEREWLEAVESGDIEEYEKKKAERNPTALTARQRTLLHGGEDQHIELPTALKGKPLTEEQIDMRKQKAIKRRQLALEKSEKAKKQTVDRLLKKSDSAIAKAKGASKSGGQRLPHIRYQLTKHLTTLSLPVNVDFPLVAQLAKPTSKLVRCGVSGCKNSKKYTCSKTNIPLCSLQCYKKNMLKSSGTRGQLTAV